MFVNELARLVWAGVSHLISNNIPHNLLICQRAAQVFLVPRAPQVEYTGTGEGVAAAVCEVAGLLVCKNQETFDGLNAVEWESFLAQSVGVSREVVDALAEAMVRGVF
eukprot:c18985_g1_i1.p3 GENE.c18985_g1_i1~~c18985_g1_i1.p3  ORF type:complete len:108 (+),score=21.28 c18985_g1_i1:740-1063(+)